MVSSVEWAQLQQERAAQSLIRGLAVLRQEGVIWVMRLLEGQQTSQEAKTKSQMAINHRALGVIQAKAGARTQKSPVVPAQYSEASNRMN